MEVFVVWGQDPEKPKKQPLMVHLLQEDADEDLLRGLLSAVAGHLSNLAPGGQMSILVTRGRMPAEDAKNPPGTFASFVIDNPETDARKADRHVWEFTVERRSSAAIPVQG